MTAIYNNSADNPNLELLNNLRGATKDLLHTSESDYPYEIILWETAQLGEFNLEVLLNIFGYLRELDANQFINGNFKELKWLESSSRSYYHNFSQQQEIVNAFRQIFQQINPYLTNIKILKLTELFILLANTPSDDRLGISTNFNYSELNYSPLLRVAAPAVEKPENRELITTLKNAIDNLKISANFVWKIAEAKLSLFNNLVDNMGIATLNKVEENIFRSYSGGAEAEAANTANQLVAANLTNIELYQIFDFYSGAIELYYLGKIQNDDRIIIKTKGIYT